MEVSRFGGCDCLSAFHTPVKRVIFKADFIQMGFLDIETIIFVEL